MECPICFNEMVSSSIRYIRSCGHQLCEGITSPYRDSKQILVIPRGEMGITLTEHTKGLQVLNVVSNDDASKAGMKSGDVIISINNIPFTNPAIAVKMIEDAKNECEIIEFSLYNFTICPGCNLL
jgi:predicted metalloprotease with PDZ domain